MPMPKAECKVVPAQHPCLGHHSNLASNRIHWLHSLPCYQCSLGISLLLVSTDFGSVHLEDNKCANSKVERITNDCTIIFFAMLK